MTRLLEKAFQEVQQLSNDEQRWTEIFATPESQSWLEKMGAKALAEHKAGKTQALR